MINLDEKLRNYKSTSLSDLIISYLDYDLFLADDISDLLSSLKLACDEKSERITNSKIIYNNFGYVIVPSITAVEHTGNSNKNNHSLFRVYDKFNSLNAFKDEKCSFKPTKSFLNSYNFFDKFYNNVLENEILLLCSFKNKDYPQILNSPRRILSKSYDSDLDEIMMFGPILNSK